MAPQYTPASRSDIAYLVSKGWRVESEDKAIQKRFTFKGFKGAWQFMTAVAESAQELKRESDRVEESYKLIRSRRREEAVCLLRLFQV